MSIVPFRWRPTEEQVAQFRQIAEQLSSNYSEAEAQKVLEKLTVPELVRVLGFFDFFTSCRRENFRHFRKLCLERYDAETLKWPDGRRRENKWD
jgi:hypothetical protein